MQPLFVVDAFTGTPFSGNPAGVLVLEGDEDERWMQAVASELNLAETSFVRRRPGENRWSLRWFTPLAEVALCGHATLAAAHLLWEEGYLRADEEARFETRSGPLGVRQREVGMEMDFPALPAARIAPPEGLLRALGGAEASFVGQTRHEEERETNYLVELSSEEEVRSVEVDLPVLARLPAGGAIVTARSEEPGLDFVSRYFAPAFGIPEDPVTGSAHCTLGPYWEGRLGKPCFRASQLSRRGGSLGVRVEGDRVRLLGEAVTAIRGRLSESAGFGTGAEKRFVENR